MRTIGSGAAMSRTKSHSPRSQTRSMIASQISRDFDLVVAHAPRREAAVHELAPLPVLGIVHVDHHRQRRRRAADAVRAFENDVGSFDAASTSA